MSRSRIIMRDTFVLEKVFDESEAKEAQDYLDYLNRCYGENHHFELRLVDDDIVLKPMLKTISTPDYQIAIASARK